MPREVRVTFPPSPTNKRVNLECKVQDPINVFNTLKLNKTFYGIPKSAAAAEILVTRNSKHHGKKPENDPLNFVIFSPTGEREKNNSPNPDQRWEWCGKPSAKDQKSGARPPNRSNNTLNSLNFENTAQTKSGHLGPPKI